MPPRYAYWTIIVDNQPTAFRAGAQEDLMPTFKRLKEKHPSAIMMWFQNGKLWPSRLDAQEAMRARGELGRRGDERQGGYRDRERSPIERPERPQWTPKPSSPRERRPVRSENLEWKPKGSFTPAPPAGRPEWKPKSAGTSDRRAPRSAKPEWKPKGFARDRTKPDWKSTGGRPKDGKTVSSSKLEWRPKAVGQHARKPAGAPEKRKWIPKEEYKKAKGIETPRDNKWRPGGEHRDPRQKYKDAKKAKWTRFKKTIRTRWESKKKKDD
jgi:hypothetical protein